MKFECKSCNHEFTISEGAFFLLCDSCLRCPECRGNNLVRRPEERLKTGNGLERGLSHLRNLLKNLL